MSEEEKQAIKWFDTERKLVEITNGDNNYFSIILNLIDKLQKENEILKYENKQVMETGQKAFIDKFMDNEFISKDIIRKKIKELKEESNGDDYTLINVINILKNLLGE